MVTIMNTSTGDSLAIAVGTSSSSINHIVSSDDDGCPSTPGSAQFDEGGDLMAAAMGDEVTAQLAAAGWQKDHEENMATEEETNINREWETIRDTIKWSASESIGHLKKRQSRKWFDDECIDMQTIDEFATRVGQQAVVVVATPGKPQNSFKVFGAKPLEDVMKNIRSVIMEELESALAQQAPPPVQDDPSLYELPPLIIDGIPTPVEKMTQAQLRAFIPLMLKYSTGRGKPGWGRESTRPPWWPKELPWANVRMDARSEEEKQKISWTHALRQIVINCYKYHGREDLLPAFSEDDDKTNITVSASAGGNAGSGATGTSGGGNGSGANAGNGGNSGAATVGTVLKLHSHKLQNATQSPGASAGGGGGAGGSIATAQLTTASPITATTAQVTTQYAPTVLQTISNPDGTVSIIQVDPSNPIITLPDGTTAQVQGVATVSCSNYEMRKLKIESNHTMNLQFILIY
ncbi:hypothetical protein C0J52_11457 [Blattella germanica]|nr:hypothetical protein C0J52_11457 [Blattella germanica]